MKEVISYLLDRLEIASVGSAMVIPWSSPVPSFGNVSRSKIATVGINPSNKEFVDDGDNELADSHRRFHTLRSLGLKRWADAEDAHHHQISIACEKYFHANPYDRWFRELDFLISGTNFSFYSPLFSACHLDLVPFATSCKWAELTNEHRSGLYSMSGDALGRLVRASPVQVLILNGSSVVSQFQRLCGGALTAERKAGWELPRPGGAGVAGYAYRGTIDALGGVQLGREVVVLGYNHNIQSSFGVTREVKASIRRWIAQSTQGILS